jgi:hypothetical protein
MFFEIDKVFTCQEKKSNKAVALLGSERAVLFLLIVYELMSGKLAKVKVPEKSPLTTIRAVIFFIHI